MEPSKMEPFTYRHSTKGLTRVFGIYREAVDSTWVEPVRAIARTHGVELAFGLLPGKGVKGNWFEIPASRSGTARGFESRFIAALEAAGLWHNGVPTLPCAEEQEADKSAALAVGVLPDGDKPRIYMRPPSAAAQSAMNSYDSLFVFRRGAAQDEFLGVCDGKREPGGMVFSAGTKAQLRTDDLSLIAAEMLELEQPGGLPE